ncbi:MAG: ABC transporter substrate-binding protein [bacterium]|nr:ABC transporter substrate-binding protein [bacterium]
MNTQESCALRVGVTAPIQKLDPRGTADFVNYFVMKQVFETTFIALSGDQRPQPTLFTEELKPETKRGEALVFSAVVKSEILFSDGTEMTPAHVYNSLNGHHMLRDRADVELKGDRLFFTLKRPDARFAHVLSNPALVVYSLAGTQVLGTGPYRYVTGSQPGQETLHLERNPHYRGADAKIGDVAITVYPRKPDGTPQALIDAIATDKVDLTFSLSKPEAEALSVSAIRKRVEPGDSTAILWFNVERPWLDNRDVRHALGLALNRNGLARHFYSSTLTFSASGILPPALGTMPDMLFHNSDKAKAMLDKAGGPVNRPLKTLLIPKARPYLPNPHEAADLISSQLGELGIKLDVQPTFDIDDYSRRTATGNYDLVLAGFISDTPNPADFLESILSSRSIPDRDGDILTRVNLSRWRSPAMDEALDGYRAMPTNDVHKREIVKILRDEMPLVPLMYGPTVTVHSSKVFGVTQEFQAYPSFAKLELKRAGRPM